MVSKVAVAYLVHNTPLLQRTMSKTLGWVFLVLASTFTSALVWMLLDKPLFPLQLDDIKWLRSWALFSTVDYELSALCFSALVLSVERPWPGVLWCLGVVVFGSGVSCAYLANRIVQHGSLRISSNADSKILATGEDIHSTSKVVAAIYGMAGLVFTSMLIWMLASHPLFPPKLSDVEWLTSWLLFSVADYELSAICMSAVFLATEGAVFGCLWSIGAVALGAGASASYIAYRLLRYGTVKFVAGVM